MVRLTTIGNFLSGIGLTLLAGAIGAKALLDIVSATPTLLLIPFYIWLIALGVLAIVLIIAIINTFIHNLFPFLSIPATRSLLQLNRFPHFKVAVLKIL